MFRSVFITQTEFFRPSRAGFLGTFEGPRGSWKLHVTGSSIVPMLATNGNTPRRRREIQPRIRRDVVRPGSMCVHSTRMKRDKWGRTARERETEKELPRDKLAHGGTARIQCARNLRNPTRKLTSEKCPSVYRGFSRVPTANQEPYTAGCLNCRGSSPAK